MLLFDRLYENSGSTEELDLFLKKNIEEINDFANSVYQTVSENQQIIKKFILLKNGIIDRLDFSKTYNKAFISLLIELCERLGSGSSLIRIYEIYKKNDIYIGERLNAVLFYLINVSDNIEFENRFDLICEKLEYSFLSEDDSKCKPVATFLNYYSYVLRNTQPYIEFAVSLKRKTEIAVKQNAYSILNDNSVTKAMSISFNDIDSAFKELQLIIDELLSKKKHHIVALVDDEILIEDGTEYQMALQHVPFNFREIRLLSVKRIRNFEFRDDIFNSLGRGVTILEEEAQLFAYMNSFGNTHYAKLISAFNRIDFCQISNPVEIVDWGCGQGIASISLFEYLEKNDTSLEIKNILLLDPSELSLKRAALHVKHYRNIHIKTVCKDLDSLLIEDVKTNEMLTKIHLFSNILDIDSFSMGSLLQLIKLSQKGINYFICASPYITDIKADRVDSFKRYFENNYDTFQTIISEQNAKNLGDEFWCCNNKYHNEMCVNHPEECGGRKRWTRINRVFKVDL